MQTALTFNSTTFNCIDRAGQVWLKGQQIAHALGYADDRAISKLYGSNQGEFTPAMTEVVVSATSDNLRHKTRIFSLRGAHLLAMFARTPVAKDFRRWVLDILDKEIAVSPAPTSHAIPGVCASLVADPYQPYRAMADDCCRVVVRHGRGALVALLAQFDADHLYRVPLHRLPEFVAIIHKVLGTPIPAPALPPAAVVKPLLARPGRQWADPAKVEETLKAMRLRNDEMYQPVLITPERVETLFNAGLIGPRQMSRLKGLMAAP